jgi:thiamine-phosphate pyrophosphorylase
MNQEILFEIKKFESAPVFFTDRKKISDIENTIKNLPKKSVIIIREYDLDKKNREIFAQKIITIAKAKGFKTLIGKDFALAKKLKADGVHFSDFDKLPQQIFRNKSFILSFSCHSLKSVLRIEKLKADMIFVSPIFPTTSHPGAKIIGLRNLVKIAVKAKSSNYAAKIYALGGINLTNLKSLRKLPISGFGAIDLFNYSL